MMLRIYLLALLSIWATCSAEVELITEPRSGEEYVFVSGGQPQTLKQSKVKKETNFETSHKIPEKLPTHYVSRDTENYSNSYSKTKPKLEETEYSPIIDVLNAGHVESSFNVKRESSEGIIEIEEDKKAIKKDYKKKASGSQIKPTEIEVEVPLSKIENIKISEKNTNYDTNAGMHVELEPMSQSGKLIENLALTTQKPILTTVAPTSPRSYDVLSINHGSADSINAGLYSDSNLSLEEAGTEQKQTRVEIKKGPNGQDYEYEYVYYYYDDDEENKTNNKKESESTPAVFNSHDGPQKPESSSEIKATNSRNKNKYSSIERSTTTTTTTTTQAPESNEVLPGSRTRYRGRNISPGSADNEATDERLPANTRFPPRSRTTTPSVHDKVEEEIVEKPSRQKSRTHSDRGNEESVPQTKNRSRPNVRRPSLELVDSASFNTHASDVPVSQYKEIRSRPNSVDDKETEKSQKQVESSKGSSRHREESRQDVKPVEEYVREDISSEPSTESSLENESSETSTTQDRDTTEITTMAAMDKVALELYAYIAGENSKNEISSSEDDDNNSTLDNSDDITTTEIITTTEEPTTTTTTAAPTTTTTTTTTTPAPTSSTTVRGSRYRARGGVKPKASATSTTTEAAPSTPKIRGRFGGNSRPQFGRGRTNSSPNVPEQQEEGSITKSEVVPVQNSVTPSRSRFGNRSRPTRTTTTAAPAEEASSTEGSVGSRLRNRPSLKLRGGKRPSGITSTTVSSAPSEQESSESSDASSAEPSSTTAKSLIGRGRLVGNLRPLRPSPRISIGGRANANVNANNNASTVATSTEGSTAASSEAKDNSAEQVDATTQQPTDVTVGNPLSRLRGRPRLQVAPSQKPKTVQQAAPRRPSPLLARRRQQEPEVSESTPTSNENPTSNEPGESAQDSNSASDETQNTSEVETPSEEPSTEAPRGISSLLARRRLANRKPGTLL